MQSGAIAVYVGGAWLCTLELAGLGLGGTKHGSFQKQERRGLSMNKENERGGNGVSWDGGQGATLNSKVTTEAAGPSKAKVLEGDAR